MSILFSYVMIAAITYIPGLNTVFNMNPYANQQYQ